MVGFRRALLVAVLSAMALWLTSATVLAGGNPGRTPAPTPPPVIGPICGEALGTIVAEVVINKEYLKTFTQHGGTIRLQVNGRQVTSITGNGKTLTLNTSGPGAFFYDANGPISLVGHGRTIYFGVDANFNIRGIWLYTGNLQVDPLTGQVISHTGNVTDICALLAT